MESSLLMTHYLGNFLWLFLFIFYGCFYCFVFYVVYLVFTVLLYSFLDNIIHEHFATCTLFHRQNFVDCCKGQDERIKPGSYFARASLKDIQTDSSVLCTTYSTLILFCY